jgi:hypothetical protein
VHPIDKFRKEAVESHLFVSDREVESFIEGTLASRRVSYRAQELTYPEAQLGDDLLELLEQLKGIRDDHQLERDLGLREIHPDAPRHGLLHRIKAALQARWS